MHTLLASFSRFGYVSAVAGLITCLSAMVAAGAAWEWWVTPIGIPLHIALPLTAAPSDRPIIVEERCATVRNATPILRLNGTETSAESLPNALRALLAVRADQVVYLDGEGCLDFGNVERVAETVRDSWEGVRVVLLTPETRRWLERRQ